jgi:hypothetical protein
MAKTDPYQVKGTSAYPAEGIQQMETSRGNSLTITENGRLSISPQDHTVALYQSDIAVDTEYA